MNYQLWQHKTSGEVYAVCLDGGTPSTVCGPLHYSERNDLDNLEYTSEDADWIAQHADEFRLVETV